MSSLVQLLVWLASGLILLVGGAQATTRLPAGSQGGEICEYDKSLPGDPLVRRHRAEDHTSRFVTTFPRTGMRLRRGRVLSPRPGFTGKERDGETGLDYFLARYYSGAQGRFTSPDPIIHPSQSQAGTDVFLSEPQRWNKYAYVSNNPLKYTDPTGAEQVGGCIGGRCFNNVTGKEIPRRSTADMLRTAAIPVAGMTAAAGGSWLAGSWAWRAILGFALSRPQETQQIANDFAESVLGAEGPGVPAPAGNFTRALSAADVGVKGALQELRGTFSLKDGLATVTVDMIRGEVKNPLQLVGNVVESARKAGASSVRIQGTLANEKLYEALKKRYGLKTEGGVDYFDVPIQ